MAAATKFSPSGTSNTASNSHCRRRTSSTNPTTQQRNVSVLPPPGPPTGYPDMLPVCVLTNQPISCSGWVNGGNDWFHIAFHRLLIRLADGPTADHQGRQETGGQEDIENDPGQSSRGGPSSRGHSRRSG